MLQLDNKYTFFLDTFLKLNKDNIDTLPETSTNNSIISLP